MQEDKQTIDSLEILTKIKRVDVKKVQVSLYCGTDLLDDFVVDTTSKFDIMVKAKDCIANCAKVLMKKYK